MRIRRSLLLTLLLLLPLAWPAPGAGQTPDEVSRLRKEVESLKEGQKALERELQEIKTLLRGRAPAPEAQARQATLTTPVVLDVGEAPFLGSKDARVTLVEFSDFQCPFCARHSKETLPALMKEYIEAGKVKYVLRDFPIASLHPRAAKAHEAAHCAGDQGKFWEMYHRLFGNLRAQETEHLTAHAKALGLDARAFEQCLGSERHAARVKKALEEGARAGVRGTPTFFVGVADGPGKVQATRMIRGAQPYASFKGAIDGVLAEGK